MSSLNSDFEIIFRKTITLKNGVVLHAFQRGLKAFPIKIKKYKNKKDK